MFGGAASQLGLLRAVTSSPNQISVLFLRADCRGSFKTQSVTQSVAAGGAANESGELMVASPMRQSWQQLRLRFQSSELRPRRYRSGLKNQMINRVVNQASKTPRAIETSASTTSNQRTSAGAGCPQYAVVIKGWESDRQPSVTNWPVLVIGCLDLRLIPEH